MKLPRDVSGRDLAKLLRRYGYEFVRQAGSHVRYVSSLRGFEHHLTIPDHKQLKSGTLGDILGDVAAYPEIDRNNLIEELFDH